MRKRRKGINIYTVYYDPLIIHKNGNITLYNKVARKILEVIRENKIEKVIDIRNKEMIERLNNNSILKDLDKLKNYFENYTGIEYEYRQDLSPTLDEIYKPCTYMDKNRENINNLNVEEFNNVCLLGDITQEFCFAVDIVIHIKHSNIEQYKVNIYELNALVD